jgi:ankyrin repeat protein
LFSKFFIHEHQYCFSLYRYAVETGYTEMVTWLLQLEDINVNLQDNSGNTALILAIRTCHIKIVNALVSRKVNIFIHLKLFFFFFIILKVLS